MLDANLELSDAQALTTADAVSTNIFDYGTANPNQGAGGKWRARAVVGTAFAGGTSIAVALQESADNSTWDDLLISDAWTAAELVASKQAFDAGLPEEHLRYLRFNYDLTGSMTSGTMTAYLYTTA